MDSSGYDFREDPIISERYFDLLRRKGLMERAEIRKNIRKIELPKL